MSLPSADLGPVGIFWDFENCSLNHTAGAWEVDNIRRIAHRYGAVKLFKAYTEISEPSSRTLNLRSELQSCGVSLTDCPHNGRKDVADKMILVDMLTFAIDTPAPATIILLSGDRDLVYAVSILRLRRYHVIVIAPRHSHDNFRSRASEILDWDVDVLHRTDTHRRHVSSDASPLPIADTTWERSQTSSSGAPSPNPRPNRRPSFRDVEQNAPLSRHPRLRSERQNDKSTATPNSRRVSLPVQDRQNQLNREFSETISFTVADGEAGVKEDLLLSTSRSPASLVKEEAPTLTPLDICPAVTTAELRSENNTLLCNSGDSDKCPVHHNPIGARCDLASRNADVFAAALDNLAVPSLSSQARPRRLSAPTVISYGPAVEPTTLSSFLTVPCGGQERPLHLSPSAEQIALGAVPNASALAPGSDMSVGTRADSASTTKVAFIADPQAVDTDCFALMINILASPLSSGDRMLRSKLSSMLMFRNPNIYTEAGCARFKDYAAKAEKLGIVELGGFEGSAWISLRPHWRGRGQFRPAHQEISRADPITPF